MKLFILLLTFSFLFACRKEEDTGFKPFFKLTVNGKKENLRSCDGVLTGGSGGGSFSCDIQGDTLLILNVGCETIAGFYIKELIKDATYQLDNKNKAQYGNPYSALYQTSAVQTGTLRIEKGSFQAPGGLIITLKGHFSFNAVDTMSGQTVVVTEGEFLMQRYHY